MSYEYELKKEDMKKVGIGALMAVAGAIVTYALEIVPQIDFGSTTPIVVAIFSVLANLARKYKVVTN